MMIKLHVDNIIEIISFIEVILTNLSNLLRYIYFHYCTALTLVKCYIYNFSACSTVIVSSADITIVLIIGILNCHDYRDMKFLISPIPNS